MTDEHANLRWMALRWLTVRATCAGIRGATEVPIDKGYVVDAAALCSLQSRHHEKLCGLNNIKPQIITAGVPELTGDVPNYYSVVFEAKISRPDYAASFGIPDRGRLRPVANLHWLVTTRKLLVIEELPDFWGLLEVSGSGLVERKVPSWQCRTEQQQDRFAHLLIWPMLKVRQEWRRVQKARRW